MRNGFFSQLQKISSSVKKDHPLKDFNTFKIGGIADYLLIAENTSQIIEAIKLANENSIKVKLLGNGSNILISDSGFRGLVIINKSNNWQILDAPKTASGRSKTKARLASVGEKFYTTEGLDYNDPEDKRIIVRADSGVRIIPFIKTLYLEGVTGLQWFAGIPATIGGAIFMNMHGGEKFFGDLVYSASIFDGFDVKQVDTSYFNFKYDWCTLHKTDEIILQADLLLYKGDVEKAKSLSIDWARRKSLQPQKSAGCVFQNLSLQIQKEINLPTSSIGYLIDKELGLKGMQKGEAIISPSHAAFIENIGEAKAADVYYLYMLIKETAHKKLGLELTSEIEFIGEF